MNVLAIIGAGSWGTALACVLAPRFREVRLWTFEQDLAARMRETRENDVYLAGFRLPANVRIETEFCEALAGADVVLSVTPSHVTRAIYGQMLPYLRPSMLFVSATKGIETKTLLRMSQVIGEVVRPRFTPRVAALSGPTFAREVAAGEPAALVISSEDRELNQAAQAAFSGPTFRLYTNTDPVGVELAASLKNVIAIGAGVSNGLGLGNNSVAALVTRGLAEITRLAVALGGSPRTLAGLAGLGDLVLTCTGALSRNRQVGIELGRGRSLAEITGSMRMVAEGIQTAYAALDLAGRTGIEMPITQQVNAILRAERSPREAIRGLMERSLKSE
ncbi:MAG: NAD(P)H-dependent glycerol-3-phosphate dehydrogenase [Acidobacteriota bacterium]